MRDSYKWVCGTPGITSLQYAGDTLLIPSDTTSQTNLKILLYYYELLTGLLINFDKSFIYPMARIWKEHKMQLVTSL